MRPTYWSRRAESGGATSWRERTQRPGPRGLSFPPGLLGSAGRRRGQRHTHRPGPQTDGLRGFLSRGGLGPGSPETPASPAPPLPLLWNWEPRSGLGTGPDDVRSRYLRYRSSMNPAVCCSASSWTRPSPLALLHHPPPTSTPEPGPGSLPQEAPPQLETRLHTQGPETAEGQVKAKTRGTD